jgi:hypothetical protein
MPPTRPATINALAGAPILALAIFFATSHASLSAPLARVPFVGCPSDGQVGPAPGPHGQARELPIDAHEAAQLAYYSGQYGDAALAPRGWHCLELMGSNGGMLFVTPETINANAFFHGTWKGIAGPGVTVMTRLGDTSGRFDVASVAARVFPKARGFVDKVIAEKIEPASEFPAGPFPADRLVYVADTLVRFETAPNGKGLGTEAWLLPTDSPIHGFAQLVGDNPNLLLLAVRLPHGEDALTETIVTNSYSSKPEEP